MAEALLEIARIYLVLGGVVAAVFCVFVVGRIDENGRDAYVFRPLLIPGTVLIWPLVLYRLHVLNGLWDESRRHRPPLRRQNRAAIAMALAIPVILAVSLAIRQPNQYQAPAVLIAPPGAENAEGADE